MCPKLALESSFVLLVEQLKSYMKKKEESDSRSTTINESEIDIDESNEINELISLLTVVIKKAKAVNNKMRKYKINKRVLVKSIKKKYNALELLHKCSDYNHLLENLKFKKDKC